MPDLVSPKLFTEHVQHRKLFDRDERFPAFADKVGVKLHVRDSLGASWVVPTLWRGQQLPKEAPWPFPFVVKARHGCGQFAVIEDDADYEAVKRSSSKWMRTTYGRWLDEWAYQEIPTGILVEPFIGEGLDLPIDYKLFVFGGRVRYIQVHLDRATDHRWFVFDLQWKRVSRESFEPDPVQPSSLGRMIAAAETLGGNFDFVRADFYEVAGRPLFGELTFYPGSGLELIEPAALDEAMGDWWTAARTGTAPAEDRLAA